MKAKTATTGATLILVVLFTLLLMAVVLAATMRLGLASRQNTADQKTILQAQYAAESGMSLARSKVRDFQTLLSAGNITVPGGTRTGNLETHSQNFCGKAAGSVWTGTTDFASSRGTSDPTPYPSAQQCLVAYNANGTLKDADSGLYQANRLSVLADYVNTTAYAATLPLNERPSDLVNSTLRQWWLTQLNTTINNGSSKIDLRPLKVVKLDGFTYRFYFAVNAIGAKGGADSYSRVVGGQKTKDGQWWIQIKLPSLLEDVLLTNHHRSGPTISVTNPDINFNDQRFYGSVRTNEKFKFSSIATAVFYDQAQSAGCTNLPDVGPVDNCTSTTGAYNGSQLVTSTSGLSSGISFSTPPNLSAPYKPLPDNAEDQKALAQASGITLPATTSGLKLFAGNDAKQSPTSYNTTSKNWSTSPYQYVEVYVNETTTNRQRWDYWSSYRYLPYSGYTDRVVEGNYYRYYKTTTTTTEKVDTRYRYGEDKKLYKESPVDSGSWSDTNTTFNGVIYGDNIPKVTGPGRIGGSTTSDLSKIPPALASFAGLTLASQGDIDIQSDLTMSDTPCNFREVKETTSPCPKTPAPRNVLGVYSSGGDITIGTSAPDNVQLQASLMAGTGKVTVTAYDDSNVGPRGDVTLIGSLIENWYGAFGKFNSTTGAPTSGYGRDFYYDTRLKDGITPPSFPVSPKWEVTDANATGARLDNVAWSQKKQAEY